MADVNDKVLMGNTTRKSINNKYFVNQYQEIFIFKLYILYKLTDPLCILTECVEIVFLGQNAELLNY